MPLPSERSTRPGVVPPHRTFPWFMPLLMILLIFLSGYGVWVWGQYGSLPMPPWLARSVGQMDPKLQILDARPNRVLMLETVGSDRRILVKDSNQSSWLLVSLDDYTISAPVLSPDGVAVAYKSDRNQGEVSIVNLDNNWRSAMDITILQSVKPNLVLCEWTPIVWSPDSSRLAFFVCQAETKQSILMWMPATVSQPTVVSGTEIVSEEERQVQWLNDSQVVVTVPSSDSRGNSQIKTVDVK